MEAARENSGDDLGMQWGRYENVDDVRVDVQELVEVSRCPRVRKDVLPARNACGISIAQTDDLDVIAMCVRRKAELCDLTEADNGDANRSLCYRQRSRHRRSIPVSRRR